MCLKVTAVARRPVLNRDRTAQLFIYESTPPTKCAVRTTPMCMYNPFHNLWLRVMWHKVLYID